MVLSVSGVQEVDSPDAEELIGVAVAQAHRAGEGIGRKVDVVRVHAVRRRSAGVDDAERGRGHAVHLPAMDIPLVVAEGLEEGSRRAVAHDARHSHMVLVDRGHDGQVRLGRVAQGLGVNVGDVGRIDQVVRHQLIPATVVHPLAAGRSPLAVAQLRNIDDQARVGAAGIAHPDPDPAVPLDHRKTARAGAARDRLLARDADAPAGSVEGHARDSRRRPYRPAHSRPTAA